MMLLLVQNVGPHRFQVRRGEGERTLAFLPRKARESQFLVNPA